ncbi:MAG: hypothetical protein AAGC47_03450 [Bacteroidota bacterium]
MMLFYTYLVSLAIMLNGPLNKDEWTDAKEGMEFIEEAPELPNDELVSGAINGLSEWVIMLRYVAIVLLVGILVFVIFRLVSGRKASSMAKDSQVQELEVESDKPTVLSPLNELWEAYKKAKNEGDYREATRILQQIAIKHLDRLGKLKAGIEKTNREYTMELNWQEKSSQFLKLTLLHEFIWYGAKEVNQTVYEQVEPNFLQFIHSIENEQNS